MNSNIEVPKTVAPGIQFTRLLDQALERIRDWHYNLQTEKTCVCWPLGKLALSAPRAVFPIQSKQKNQALNVFFSRL
jgi:hypothetical protein